MAGRKANMHLINWLCVNVIDDDRKAKDLWCNETWDFSRVVTHIPQLIKHCIMAVSIHSLHVVDDCVVWADNISGVYTTCGCYIEMDMSIINRKWSWLQKLNAPEKIIMLICLIFHDSLPTNLLRFRRHRLSTNSVLPLQPSIGRFFALSVRLLKGSRHF